ncbi:MAG: response regulator transcription factor [Thermomicrobiales bacterium]
MQQGVGGDLRATVLVVDDEQTLREMIGINLKHAGIDVIEVETGNEALEQIGLSRPDMVVLDVMLPGLDGFEVCRRIREVSTVPILLLSAKGEEIDRVIGLEIGADDYLTKPFAMRELLARVRAMLRRAKMSPTKAGQPTEAQIDAPERLESGDLWLDPRRRTAMFREAPLHLKPKEFDLLQYLMRHRGIVLSRDALLREVWGYEFAFDTRTIDVHIRWLRSKIEIDPARPTRIETIRGHGYRFVHPHGE